MAPSHWACILALALARLPKPPDAVVLQNRYGKITVDHRAHLARRAPCVQCHGEGTDKKIGRLGMTVGHERCRGCHKDEERGPVECSGCHQGAKPLGGAGASPESTPGKRPVPGRAPAGG